MNRLTRLIPQFNILGRSQSRTLVTRSRVARGGHGHGHGSGHHQPAGPYDPVHHPTYPTKAYPFNLHSGHGGNKIEWVDIGAIIMYVFMFGTIYATMNNDPNKFENWARKEALAREEILANGGTVEFGVWYAQHDPPQFEFPELKLNLYPRIKDKEEA